MPQMLSALMRLARPADWSKNVLVFPALLASGQATQPESVRASIIAFAAFSCVASGVYSINDAIDCESDRRHPIKRNRPIPSGQVSPTQAIVAGAVWIVFGIALCGVLQADHRTAMLAILGGYLVLQIAYNAVFKHMAVVDVVALSIGFVLRAIAGAAAIGVVASLWLLTCVLFLCLYLAEIKRLCDLVAAERSGAESGRADESGESWKAAAGYDSPEELNWTLGVSAALSVLTFEMYAMSPHALEAAGPGVRGFVLLTPLVVIAMFRFYRAARRGESDSPLHIAVGDPVVVVCTSLFILGAVACLYVDQVARILEIYFEI